MPKLMTCSACANGYDGSLMTSIVAMKHFQQTTGVMPKGIHNSVMMSLYPVYVSLTASLLRCRCT